MFGFGTRKPAVTEEVQTPPPVMVAGCVGKTPELADFISARASYREVQEIESLLRQWYLEHQQALDHAPLQAFGFLMTGGHDRQGLAGHFFPSQDSHGRLYPLIYFTRWSLATLYFRPSTLFHASETVLEQIDVGLNHQGIPQLSALKQLLSLSDDQCRELLPTNPVRDAMTRLSDWTLERWLITMVGADPLDWQQFIDQSVCQLQQFKQGRVDPHSRVLTLPLGPEDCCVTSLCFWLMILEGQQEGNQWRPDVLWQRDESDSKAHILPKPLTVSQLDRLLYSTLRTEDQSTDINLPDDRILTDNQAGSQSSSVRFSHKILKDPSRSLLDIAIAWSRQA